VKACSVKVALILTVNHNGWNSSSTLSVYAITKFSEAKETYSLLKLNNKNFIFFSSTTLSKIMIFFLSSLFGIHCICYYENNVPMALFAFKLMYYRGELGSF
jgi:hypothetical protein